MTTERSNVMSADEAFSRLPPEMPTTFDRMLEAARADVAVEQLGDGFSNRTIEIARYLQAALAEIRSELHLRAEAEGILHHEIDRACGARDL